MASVLSPFSCPQSVVSANELRETNFRFVKHRKQKNITCTVNFSFSRMQQRFPFVICAPPGIAHFFTIRYLLCKTHIPREKWNAIFCGENKRLYVSGLTLLVRKSVYLFIRVVPSSLVDQAVSDQHIHQASLDSQGDSLSKSFLSFNNNYGHCLTIWHITPMKVGLYLMTCCSWGLKS